MKQREREALAPDSWRGNSYKLKEAECWIDAGDIDIWITKTDTNIAVKLYRNTPDRELLSTAYYAYPKGGLNDESTRRN